MTTKTLEQRCKDAGVKKLLSLESLCDVWREIKTEEVAWGRMNEQENMSNAFIAAIEAGCNTALLECLPIIERQRELLDEYKKLLDRGYLPMCDLSGLFNRVFTESHTEAEQWLQDYQATKGEG